MDSEDILGFFSMDEESILERVDEYTLYCFYLTPLLGEEPIIRKAYSSPVRDSGDNADDSPSFGIYYTDRWPGREFFWTDQAKGRRGDIFMLVKYIFGLEKRTDALKKIKSDFKIGPDFKVESKIKLYVRKEKVAADIQIASRPFKKEELEWWKDKFNASQAQLEYFNTVAPKYYWINETQRHPIYPKDLTFAYRIRDRYQIYRPYAEKKYKFRNDWNDNCVPGASQLKFRTDTLFITKAYKDVICLDSFKEFDVLAGRGENIMIPDHFMKYLLTKFKYIITFMDNDGKNHTAAKYQEQYGANSMIVPRDAVNSKDPAGYCENYGSGMLYEFMQQAKAGITAFYLHLLQYRGAKVTVKDKDTFIVLTTSVAYSIDHGGYLAILIGGGKRFYINFTDLKHDVYVHT